MQVPLHPESVEPGEWPVPVPKAHQMAAVQFQREPVLLDADAQLEREAGGEGEAGQVRLFALPRGTDAAVADDSRAPEADVEVQGDVRRNVGVGAGLKVEGESVGEIGYLLRERLFISSRYFSSFFTPPYPYVTLRHSSLTLPPPPPSSCLVTIFLFYRNK